MRRYFVTGTGTGVGKTYVTCAIAKLARERGLQVVAHKPIETGCPRDARNPVTGRVGEDQARLLEVSSGWLSEQEPDVRFGPYQFERPLAPSVASTHESVDIDFTRIERALARASRGPSGPVDLFLVEGAGGWRVPISDSTSMRDLARMVDGEVIVVGLGTLGTINHSLLTVETIERDGFSVAALVLSNRPEEPLDAVRSNVSQIQRWWGGRVLLVNDLDELLPLHVEHPRLREAP